MPAPRRNPLPKLPRSRKAAHVTVTDEVIANACRRDSGHCMIADALKMMNPGVNHVDVDLQTIRFSDPAKGARYIYLTPPLAQRALIRFDQGETVEPFDFTLRTPTQIVRAGAHPKGAPSNARQGTAVSRQGTRGRPTTIGGKALPKAALTNRVPANGVGLKASTRKATRTKTTTTTRNPDQPPNLVLAKTKGLVRQYGLKQLKP
jgi:hypothetical protein